MTILIRDIRHTSINTKTNNKKSYNYLKCEIINCLYIPTNKWGHTCYESAVKGHVTSCTHWETVDPFRLFIAIEREKRKC